MSIYECPINPITLTLTLILTLRDPDYQQNLTVSSVARVAYCRRILWKSVE